MNYLSKSDDSEGHPNWNQRLQAQELNAITSADLSGTGNLQNRRQPESSLNQQYADKTDTMVTSERATVPVNTDSHDEVNDGTTPDSSVSPGCFGLKSRVAKLPRQTQKVVTKYARFVGPGSMIAVAYIDPGNYATDVQAGASTRYRHLFIVLLSNLFAIFLQSLCIKLGSVTGLNLAENCRRHLPRWLNIILYILAEAAIVATDIAEVTSPWKIAYG